MLEQTDHQRARIIDAHDARAQEAYWGGEPEQDDLNDKDIDHADR